MKAWDLNNESKLIQLTIALITAFTGGIIFTLVHLPIPWLLGPMTALLLASRFKKVNFFWPGSIRDTGLIIVGYSIGISFTKNSIADMTSHLPSMLFFTSLIVPVCASTAFFVSKFSVIDYPTALTSCIPGGLSQIIVFAEEIKVIDTTTVTFFHVTRVLMVIFLVPLFIFSPIFGVEKSIVSSGVSENVIPQWHDLFPLVFLFAPFCFITALIGKRIKLPAPYLLGPLIGTAAVNLWGFHGPPLPASFLDASQFMVGGYIGLLLKPEQLNNKKKIISLAIASGLIMIFSTMLFSFLLAREYNLSFITSFLSLAPGGMDQMGIISHEVNADLSTVTSYQLFRLVFIYIMVPPMLRLVLKLSIKNKTVDP